MSIILRIAHIVSLISKPFYLPLLGIAALFLFSILKILPWQYRVLVIVMVWGCTVMLPTLIISLYHKTQGMKMFRFVQKEKRVVPYAISIICYFLCYWLLTLINAHHTIKSVLVAALMVQMVCAIINIWWKISAHTAAIGSFLGGLVAFSYIFVFNPIWWICVILFVGGIVGTCRMILRQHTLGEVVGGYCVGFIGALLTILLL
ncbi:MAG: hypothetical protein MJZ32_03680 [Bacteroidaceae bacterium]|nr:hypothetical protein [Bacteroidaceae bacterium]